MNEQQRQALAVEWHKRYQEAERQVTQHADTGLGDVGYVLTTCVAFAFFAGAETERRYEHRQARREDRDTYLALTVQEVLHALRAAGIDVMQLDQLRDLLHR